MLPKVILLGTCHSFGRLLCFLFDGIFIGATATHLMLKAMIAASVSFFLIYYGFRGAMGNHALWMAFITYLLLRGVMQGVMGRNILGYKTSKKINIFIFAKTKNKPIWQDLKEFY